MTVKAYTTDLKILLKEIGEEKIDAEDFEEVGMNWLTANRNKVAPKTTGRRLTSLRAFAKWAGWSANFNDYSPPQPAKAMPHPIPEGMDGVRRMIAVARNERQAALVALMGFCGLRVAEALRVRPSDFDLEEMLLTVHGKGDKIRHVPVSVAAWEVLQVPVTRAFCNGDVPVVGLKDRFARTVINRLGKRAALSRPVSSHDLRATFATSIYDKTLDQRLVQELLGHSSSMTTEIYIGVSLAKMKLGVEQI